MTPQERKVMELALEALKLIAAQDQGCGGNVSEAEAWRSAQSIALANITVIKEALAQPEQEMVSKARYNRMRDDYNEAIELLRLAGMAAKNWNEHKLRCQLQGVDLDHNFARPEQEPVAKGMTAHRAAYFMERFKHEEKLLGPNEQAALDFVIAMLVCKGCNGNGLVGNIFDADTCPFCHGSGVEAPPQRKPLTREEIADLRHKFGITSDGRGIKEFTQVEGFVRAIEATHNIKE